MYGLDQIDFIESEAAATAQAGQHTAVRWSRAIFEYAPAPVRQFLRFGWWILRLRLAPPGSPGHVLGWPVAGSDEERAVLATTSGLGLEVRLVIERTDTQVSVTTLIHFTRRGGELVWKAVVPLHRLIIRRLLRRAA
ncbi:MAG TPA: DUF2867 domain-containing protein [Mycobacteriales bacterium]|nr:DUF2867 domain-containing protein [Mycobacteriales bacterium]